MKLIHTETVAELVHRGIRFRVLRGDDGRFYAERSPKTYPPRSAEDGPFFCLDRTTEQAAAKAGEESIDDWAEMVS